MDDQEYLKALVDLRVAIGESHAVTSELEKLYKKLKLCVPNNSDVKTLLTKGDLKTITPAELPPAPSGKTEVA